MIVLEKELDVVDRGIHQVHKVKTGQSRRRGEYGKIIIFIVWLRMSKWSCQGEAGKESFGGLKPGAILI